MMFDHLQTLTDYHYWARDRLLDAVYPLAPEQFTRHMGNSFPSIRDTLVHLYGADVIWCARWQGESPQAMPDAAAFPDLAAIGGAWTGVEQRVRGVLAALGPEGILRPIEYQRSGLWQAQPFWQTLQHLVNHGSMHRGQVITMLRQIGAAPPASLDLISFYRERANAAT